MVFSHIFRNIPAGRRRQDKQRIDQQNADPFDGQHDDQGDKDREQVFDQADFKLSAFCQDLVQADGLQPVIAKDPEDNRGYQYKEQIYDLSSCDTQHIPQQQAGIFTEIPSP